jgi:hypothetical protein
MQPDLSGGHHLRRLQNPASRRRPGKIPHGQSLFTLPALIPDQDRPDFDRERPHATPFNLDMDETRTSTAWVT